jgi:uncharacterized protein
MSTSPTPEVAAIVAALDLEPHPEGGFFRETYRAVDVVDTPRGVRRTATAIVFLVTGERPSRFHRLTSDELWLWQGGEALDVVLLTPGVERSEIVTIGPVGGDARQMARVPAHTWQAARLAPAAPSAPPTPGDRRWSLVSCVVTPGFEYEDFVMAETAALQRAFPGEAALVAALT